MMGAYMISLRSSLLKTQMHYEQINYAVSAKSFNCLSEEKTTSRTSNLEIRQRRVYVFLDVVSNKSVSVENHESEI